MVSRNDINKHLHGEGLFGESLAEIKAGKLSEYFMIPPLTVLSAREGWWQDRKRAWLALGIKSELGRGGDMTWGTGNDLDGYRHDQGMSSGNISREAGRAAPGGSAMPAMNYKNRERGTGAGTAIRGTGAGKTVSNPATDSAGTLLIDRYRGKTAKNSSLAHPTAMPTGSTAPTSPPIIRRPPIIPAAKAPQPESQPQSESDPESVAELQPVEPVEEEEKLLPPEPVTQPVKRAPPVMIGRTAAVTERIAPTSNGAAMPAGRRFGAPAIIVGTAKPSEQTVTEPSEPLEESSLIIEARKHGVDRIKFDEDTWDDQKSGSAAVGVDVECYPNFFVVCLRRFDNPGKRIAFELSDRHEFNRERLRTIMKSEVLITFNGMTYDMPMIALALRGASVSELKLASDRIILDKMKYWDIEKQLGVVVPSVWNHIDLKEPNPSVRQGLKTLNGRLHGQRIMNLPYKPDAWLSPEQMNVVTLYCMEADLDGTKNLFYALKEPLMLRQNLTKRYGVDVRSKSDAQVGEAVVRKRIETLTKRRIKKSDDYIRRFKFSTPPFISFNSSYLQSVLKTIEDIDFTVNGAGRVDKPEVLEDLTIHIGQTHYKMGIGGLHSLDSSRALVADDEYIYVDADVAGHYPAIIVRLSELGLYPPAAGKSFTTEYGSMLRERNDAKRGAAAAKIAKDKITELRLKAEADGGKIANNGVFGKLLSLFSFLHHPPLGIGCTITGQLSVLMLIERAEAEGISAVSGNTDGVLFKCPRNKLETLLAMLKRWEGETGFEVETAKYKAVYARDINTYYAIKEDGSVKRKGYIGNPWRDNDLRGQLSKNPQMTVCSDAVLDYIKDGTPLEQSIRSCTDIRAFLTIIKVENGAEWRKTQLGEVVRYYWSTRGEAIRYVGSKKKVAKTDGARPMMELKDELPSDIDYAHYVREATEIAYDVSAMTRQSVFNTGSN